MGQGSGASREFHFHRRGPEAMLAGMVERVFLGWDRPFLAGAADWLLERREELPRWLVVVPTSQSGRRLREALAESAGALLSPKFVTPGSFLKTEDASVAADWMERVAWLEALEEIDDWENYGDLFPEPPDADGDWAGGLAVEMLRLRHAMQENGLTLSAAARVLSGSVEAGRWEALGSLEKRMERHLNAWGLKSRSRVLAGGVALPDGIAGIVLAGITEMPPLLERALQAWDGTVRVLIGAPETEAAAFSIIGKPLETWTERTMPWPDGKQGAVRLVADTRSQATEAWQAVIERQSASNDVALGTADVETGDELARVFTRGGWTAFHPAARMVTAGLSRWLIVFSRWLAEPKLSVLSDLLAMPETGALIGGRRAENAAQLSRLRNEWMAILPEDLRHRMATVDFRSDAHRASAAEVLRTSETLERWREDFQRGDFAETMSRLLDKTASDEAMAIHDWLTQAEPVMRRLKRGPGFWIDVMLAALPSPTALPPEGRVIDVQGWLELLFEPGTHLVLCGMNEGKVPARNTGDPWLGEAASKQLGLIGNADRAARDAFLYQAMLMARQAHGRVDVICAKSGDGGDALLPSRLLLAADRDELPARVKFLFRGIEPPEAGLRWEADWQWQPRKTEVSMRLNVTSLASYLACPFRFYLKHSAAMQSPEPDRVEWNARDFGNVAHEVLERWGRDEAARDLADEETLHAWWSGALDEVAGEWFGRRPPLAVRVQTEVLRQRFIWLSRVQARVRQEGWQVIEVEHKFELEMGGATVVAKIDRIDRHRESGELRVIDYKTGKVDAVDRSHRRKLRADHVLPAHLPADSPAVYSGQDKGKPADFLWQNLQLPLYAAAVELRDGVLPLPCYLTLGNTEAEVDLRPWEDFTTEDMKAAKACATWIAGRISEGVFWPPAEKVTYDDFAILSAGRKMEEMFAPVE